MPKVAVAPEIHAAAIISATNILISQKIQNSKGSHEKGPTAVEVADLTKEILDEIIKRAWADQQAAKRPKAGGRSYPME
jgi:hypothetical protein